MRSVFGLWLVVMALAACERTAPAPRMTKAALVAQTIDERMADYVDSYARRCRREALEAAEVRVDSILLARAFGDRDTTGRPPRTAKPERPPLLRPSDSIGWVKPIVE